MLPRQRNALTTSRLSRQAFRKQNLEWTPIEGPNRQYAERVTCNNVSGQIQQNISCGKPGSPPMSSPFAVELHCKAMKAHPSWPRMRRNWHGVMRRRKRVPKNRRDTETFHWRRGTRRESKLETVGVALRLTRDGSGTESYNQKRIEGQRWRRFKPTILLQGMATSIQGTVCLNLIPALMNTPDLASYQDTGKALPTACPLTYTGVHGWVAAPP